jgi:hypothetical protein
MVSPSFTLETETTDGRWIVDPLTGWNTSSASQNRLTNSGRRCLFRRKRMAELTLKPVRRERSNRLKGFVTDTSDKQDNHATSPAASLRSVVAQLRADL